jgi:elongator complex protein 5
METFFIRSNEVLLMSELPVYSSCADTLETREEISTTFKLDLSEREREARDKVVLPYFDAQKGEGEGGRILYEMGREDDFDEEEDEI